MDQQRAKQLMDQGYLDPAVYQKAFGSADQGAPVAQPTATPVAPQTGTPAPAPALTAPATPEDTSSEGKRKVMEQRRAEEEKRMKLAQKAGLNNQPTNTGFNTTEAELFANERNFAAGEPVNFVQPTTGAPAAPAGDQQPQISLASDTMQAPTTQRIPQMGMGMSTPGLDLQQQAIAQAAVAGASKAAEETAYYQKMQDDMQTRQEAFQASQQERQNKIQEQQSKLAGEIERVNQLSVDPNRFWANKDTADKIQIGIGMLLGAFGSAGGGGNRAAQTIQNAINRDINIQKSNIAGERRGVTEQRGLLNDMKATFNDEAMAEQAANAAYLNQAQLKVKEIASRYTAPDVQAKAAGLIGQLENQKQLAQQKFMQDYIKKLPVSADTAPEMMTKEQRDRFVPGYGLALNKETAAKGRELVGTIDSIKGNIDQLELLSNKSGSSISPSDRARANTISSILIGQLRLPIVGPGAVSEKELELLNNIIADPTRIFSLDSSNKERLKTLRERMDEQTRSQLKTFGLTSPADKLDLKDL